MSTAASGGESGRPPHRKDIEGGAVSGGEATQASRTAWLRAEGMPS